MRGVRNEVAQRIFALSKRSRFITLSSKELRTLKVETISVGTLGCPITDVGWGDGEPSEVESLAGLREVLYESQVGTEVVAWSCGDLCSAEHTAMRSDARGRKPVKVIRRLILLVVVVGVALRLAGVPLNSSLLWVAATAEACLVALVIFAVVRVVRRRGRAPEGEAGPRGWEALRGVLRESLPEGVTEAVLSEARILVAAFMSLARRPIKHGVVKPGWRRFSVETTSYGNVVVMLLLLIVLEAPAVHLILGAVMEEGTLRSVIRGVLLGSSIYLAVWLLGDLRLLRESPGVLLGPHLLAVELGLRVNGEVTLENVTGAQPSVAQDAKPETRTRAIRITPHAPPNCRIRLGSEVSMRGIFGIPLKGEALDLHVENPADLVSAIEAAIAARRVESAVG